MGCYGYICRGCNTPIRGNSSSGGEKCVLIHVRHGKEVGRTEGHYDEYGGVVEDKLFSSTEKNPENLNSHAEICESSMRLPDSFHFTGRRLYKGEALDKGQVHMKVAGERKNPLSDKRVKASIDKYNGLITEEECQAIFDETVQAEFQCDVDWKDTNKVWDELEPVKDFAYSGIVAWHSKCYRKAEEASKSDLTPSFPDPDQSWGKVRKKYL